MATITIRVSDKEKIFLQFMSEFLGLSLSDVVKQYTIVDLEDIYDAKVGDEAYKAYLDSGEEAISIEEVTELWDVK